jgi:hypothetical protein
LPKTLLDSFSSLAAASGDEHSSITELRSSVLFLLHASMISSDGFAPYKLVSFKFRVETTWWMKMWPMSGNKITTPWSPYLMLLILLRAISEISHLGV